LNFNLRQNCLLFCRKPAHFFTEMERSVVESGIPHQGKHAQAGLTTLDVEIVRQHAAELLDRNTWPRDRLSAYQQERLQHALRHAVDSSPFYKETIGELVVRGAPLDVFPVLAKRDLMANFDRIVIDKRLTRGLIEQHLESQQAGSLLFGEYLAAATGGTSGERGVFVYNRQAWLSVTANIVRLQRMLGVLPNTRSIGIGAPSPIHLSNRFYAELRAGRPGVPSLGVTMPVEHVIEALNSYQPEALTTYPSFMRVLAHEQQSGRLKISPRFFRSGAETLTAEVKDLVRAVWNVPVFNGYASTEVGVMGQECEHQSGIHLAEDLSIYEVVDEQNRPLPAGVPGAKILVTTLTNPTLPLVRYELTDVVALASGTCRCGLPFTRLASIEGRREEVLRFPRNGGGILEVHAIRLHSPLIGMEGLRQFQLAQLPDGLQISISVRPELDPEAMRLKAEQTLRTVLEKLGVSAVRIDVKVVDAIARVGSGAKMKLVVKAQPD
jgi:phenylacetate-CoA ligase